MYKYPYGDSQQLNLDWILAKIKELEASGASGGADLETVSNALISLTYNTSTAYRRYDYAFLNGKLYRCITDTSGVFNPTAWQEALIGDDLAILTRWINAINAAAVVDVKFDTSGTNGKIQQKYNDNYHDVVEVDYTPVQNSKRPLSSNAGYDLDSAVDDIQKQITAYIQTSNTATRAYSVGDYLVLNGKLYRVTANIANGGTITINTNVVETTVMEIVPINRGGTGETTDINAITALVGGPFSVMSDTVAANTTKTYSGDYNGFRGLLFIFGTNGVDLGLYMVSIVASSWKFSTIKAPSSANITVTTDLTGISITNNGSYSLGIRFMNFTSQQYKVLPASTVT